MGSGMMGGGPGRHDMGMMRVAVHPATVRGGVVSLRVLNTGALTHEVVVLPLRTGQGVGERSTGPDGRVSEAGSAGEVSRSCHAGSGDGITPGSMAWTTLTLPPGRYELVCNLPGHYQAGAYAKFVVTAR
ncbi:sulfocyanin-like copper-binding protein [Streptomyces mirabilis]|uniref:sulfocyanin-like copper-binding protein n=1 Tax=Streptomyces mirabilis TaxID=68239 RepID=UPI003648924F